jgi:hypothetical protein
MKLTPEQLERVRRVARRWEQFVAPCEISYADVYNPCLPEDVPGEPGRLRCVTCGLRQRLALEAP